MEQIRPKLEMCWLTTVDKGRQLELNFTDGDEIFAAALIFADDTDESLFVEVEVGERLVQIPAEQLLEALRAAEGQVHSEAWFEKQRGK